MDNETTTPIRPKRKYQRRKPRAQKAKPDAVGESIKAAIDSGAFQNFPDEQTTIIERAPIRPPVREEDPRAAADRKAREWFQHVDTLSDGQDKYYIDPAKFPPGWTYEWKMHEVLNKQDPQYQVALAHTAWTAVPANRHPEMMPVGFKGATIDIGGMRLMERPEQITAYQKAKEARNARAPLENLRAKLGAAPAGTFERGSHPGAPVTVKTGYSPPEIPAA